MKWRERLSSSRVTTIGYSILRKYFVGQEKYKGYHGNPIYHAMEELHDAEIHLLMAERRDLYARELLEVCLKKIRDYSYFYHTNSNDCIISSVKKFLEDATVHPGFMEESNVKVD